MVLAPEPVKVKQGFHHPFLIEDMTTLLAAARLGPIPLRRGDDRPFSRFVEETGAMLLSLPEWLETFTGLTLEARIGLALQALRITGLLVPLAGAQGGGVPLAPSAESEEWIHLPLSEKCGMVVRTIAGLAGTPSRLFDLMEEEWSAAEGAREEILPWIVQAFSSVPVTTFIRFADFAEYQAAIGSPLSAASTIAGASRGEQSPAAGSGMATEEAMEELWKSFLAIFLGRCLLALGGAEAGVTPDGRPGFRMRDGGRVLLGLPRDALPDRDEEESSAASVLIVQPNFEIVFLSPSAAAEAALGRFCERVGREVGVLFRLTRQSLLRAASAGLETEQVLAALTQGSRNPLPPNVEHEIRGWMGAAAP